LGTAISVVHSWTVCVTAQTLLGTHSSLSSTTSLFLEAFTYLTPWSLQPSQV